MSFCAFCLSNCGARGLGPAARGPGGICSGNSEAEAGRTPLLGRVTWWKCQWSEADRSSQWRSPARTMVMRRSRKAHFKQSRRTQWHRTERPSLKSLGFCSVIGLGRKADQTACFPGDTLSAVPLKTSSEMSPCHDSGQGGTSACTLRGSGVQVHPTRCTGCPPAVRPALLSSLLPLACPAPSGSLACSSPFLFPPRSLGSLLLTLYEDNILQLI